jgi:hypothetical protein
MAAASCAVDSVKEPGLTGPSTLSTDITVTVTPDVVPLDGLSTATVGVVARGVDGRGIPNLEFKLFTSGGTNLGTIAPFTVYTDANGRATAQFIPVKASPALAGAPPTQLTIVATPVRSNYQTASNPSASVLLLYPATPTAAPGTPTAAVNYLPATPKVGNLVTFDGSTSQAASGASLVDYTWNFGDTTPNDEHGNDASHAYWTAGTYYVTLAVTDDKGRTGYTFKAITVTN